MNCDSFPENELCIRENKTATKPSPTPPKYKCPAPLKVPPDYEYSVKIGDHVEQNCGIPCYQYFFNDAHARRFARLWIGLWSSLCVASTLFTVLTFIIDMQRFKYPERPIIFLSGCYFMIALTYVVGFILNDKYACSGPFTSPDTKVVPAKAMPKIITQGTKVEGCIILFMLLYFFSMASSIWWVILTVTWYLAAKCHWAHEAIAQNSQYFHFFAWAIPAAKTIGVLAWNKVDGDPFTGVCFTGISDVTALRAFLIAPLCLYLFIGIGFLVAGFVSMLKIRTIIKTEGTKTDKLEKLIVRIGMFSVLYIMPAVIVIACYFHESRMHFSWMISWYTEVCRTYRQEPSCALHERRLAVEGGAAALEKPEFELFMIKYLMTLIVGITSGIWIWSGKTLLSWRRFGRRIFRRKVANPTPGPGPVGNTPESYKWIQRPVPDGNPGLMGPAHYHLPPGNYAPIVHWMGPSGGVLRPPNEDKEVSIV